MPDPIRVTDDRDGDLNRAYSYWSQAYVQGDEATCFVGHADGRPRFFRVHLPTGQVDRLGSLLGYGGTSEGWYWDQQGWIYVCDGPALRRVNPFTGDDQVVYDISQAFPGCRLWQAHSADDGRTHSATVQLITNDGPYLNTGTIVFVDQRHYFYEARGTLDESQITSDGRYVVIKENDDNRIIRLEDGNERLLTDNDGAVGHSDCGPSYVVGEDNIHGQCVRWDLDTLERRDLFGTWGMGHVSVKAGRCVQADESSIWSVDLEQGGRTKLVDHGMAATSYDTQCMANLSPCGHVVAYLASGVFYLLPL